MAVKAPKILDQEEGDGWTLYNADCVDVAKGLPDDKLGFSIYSPPFISLFTFSDSDRDMSNCSRDTDFWDHYRFLVRDLYRTTMPGRLTAVHCMDLPTSKLRDGFIGLQDFPGKIIRLHQEEGWIYHSRVAIWKNPVSAMQRTKAIGLLHKQVVKDSTLSRMAVADYIVALRKPGDQNDVLSFRQARDVEDERHISPLQLTPIRRCIDLWSNPADTAFSPFAGIGSELYCAVEMDRKALGVELKSRHTSRTKHPSYYEQAIDNLRSIKAKAKTADLFDAAEPDREESVA